MCGGQRGCRVAETVSSRCRKGECSKVTQSDGFQIKAKLLNGANQMKHTHTHLDPKTRI